MANPAPQPVEEPETETPAPANEAGKKPEPPKVKYSMSPGFVPLLGRLKMALAFTSYQSGKFYLLGRNPAGGLMVDERFFQKAMGIAVQDKSLALATLFQLHRFENILNPGQAINNKFDSCFVPRITYTTGVLDAHDIGIMKNGSLIFVNTRYNCLAVPSSRESFIPVWKPPFISAIVAEDRCHLNGMAMDQGRPAYVTAVSKSDTIDGWRDRRADGGVVMDIRSNTIVCEGLSMPHSPRLRNGTLWVLNSGTGELGTIDLVEKRFVPKIFCPGFLRGLAFAGNYAFVGLSKPRYERFEGLALDQKLKDTDSTPWCGIQAINLEKNTCEEWFRIDGGVAEIYDCAAIPGVNTPMSLGFLGADIRTLITHADLDPTHLAEE